MNQKSPGNLSAKDLHGWLQETGGVQPLVIDVREDDELEIAPFPFSVMHLPLSKSSQWIGSLHERIPSNTEVVVICHAGIRSWRFGTWLINQNWGCVVWNLVGGIDAWSTEVDSTCPRY